MYKLGMPTLIELNSIEENIELCNSLGLDFIELNMNLPYCMPEYNNVKNLREITKAHNLNFTMHFPEEIDFATFYPTIRNANIELFKELVSFGAEVNVDKINIHINTGVHFSLPNQKVWIYNINKNRFIDNLVSSMMSISNISKQYGIKICLENTIFTDFIEDAFYNLSELENIYFAWDIGHDAKDNHRATNFYLNNIRKIAHMHLHDYNGNKDHLCLYDGVIDISSRINFARHHNLSTVIEVKTRDSLEKSIYRLNSNSYK